MLETQAGSLALAQVGRQFVIGRAAEHEQDPDIPVFGGDINNMDNYVAHFLQSVRADYPNVILDHNLSLDISGYTVKGAWGDNLERFRPKGAGAFYYNGSVSYITCSVLKLAHFGTACQFHGLGSKEDDGGDDRIRQAVLR